MYAWQFAKAQNTAERAGSSRFVSMQNHYNLIYREEEREMIPFCLDQGIGMIPWSPLARGLLGGARSRAGARNTLRSTNDPLADEYYVESDFDVVDAVAEIARRHGYSPAQVALAWLLSRPGVTAPIVGSTQQRHVEDAVASLDVQLSDEEAAFLEGPYRPHRILGHT
jgi:1-deoxyxylulose-5-phosphate synthase